MSVIVKNMEMPKTCGECWLYEVTKDMVSREVLFLCKCRDAVVENPYTTKSKDCPLIELPPHGRLIAEKTITEIRYHDADGYHIVNGEQLCELEIDAETVIEEGETDGR